MLIEPRAGRIDCRAARPAAPVDSRDVLSRSQIPARRILCVTSNFPRRRDDSTTPFVLHLAQDLQALGWQVDVLAPHAPGAALAEVIDGVHVERFRYLRPERLQTVCYQGGALINLRMRPLEWLKLPALVAAQWLAVRRRLARGDYVLLHTHWLLPQGFVGALAARAGGIPHVTTVHGGDVFALRGRLLRRFKRIVIDRADRVTANSSVTEQAVRDLASPGARLVRIPMGVGLSVPDANAPEVQRLRARYRRGAGPMLVFVGRLVQEKGVADLLGAIAMLRDSCPDLTALVIGEGQDRDAFAHQAAVLGVTDRVHFMGWIQNHRVGAHVAAADVFVSPSRRASNGWVEAQGLAMLEAMAAGTPVIATAEGGVIDAVTHRETGLLVQHRAPDQIAAAVLQLVRDPRLAGQLAVAARERVERHFSRASSAGAFSALFQELLAKRVGA